MIAIEVFFSGTPQQFAGAVNNLVGSRLLPETGKIVFDVRQRKPDKVLIRVQTPEDIPHAESVTISGSYITEIEAHTVPAGACVTLRPGLHREYDPVALRWWEVLLARLRFEGWRVWTAGEPAQADADADAPKIGAPKPTSKGGRPRNFDDDKVNGQRVKTIQNSFRTKLRQGLVDSFSEEELRTLCFDMGLDYEDLPAQGKAGKAREIVAHFERINNVPSLVEQCRRLRPNRPWDEMPE
jgi:hypothetical protein